MGEAFICRREVLAISAKKWLYDFGDECIAITGGWSKKFNRFSEAQGILIKNSNSMSIESSSLSGYTNTTGAGTNFQINFQGYTKLCFDYDVTIISEIDSSGNGISAIIGAVSSYPPSNTGAYFTFTNTLTDSRIRLSNTGIIQESHIITKINISGINSGYVAFDAWYANTGAFKGRSFQTVHRVWLE